MGKYPFYFTELKGVADDAGTIPYTIGFQQDPAYFIAHRHNYVEFMYVVKGSGYETVNNVRHELKPGTFSIMLPYQVHSLYYESGDPLSIYVGAIGLDILLGTQDIWRGLGEILFRSEGNPPTHVLLEGDAAFRMEGILKEMLLSFRERDLWGELMFKARLIEALVLFDRIRQSRRNPVCTAGIQARTGPGARNDFWDVVYYVQTHYSEHITLKSLAERFHLSVPYISTSFKKHIGENYLIFLNGVRIQNACSLLVSTDMSITDIAFEVGYESYETFSRFFQKIKRTSAKAYRKEKR